MGGCVSQTDRSRQERSDEIDRQIEEDSKRLKREHKVLLLGLPGSGQSTIVKQMKIIHQGFSEQELGEYRTVIYENVIKSAQEIVTYMRKTGLECAEYSNRALAERVLYFRFDTAGGAPHLPAEFAAAIYQLRKDAMILKVIEEHSNNFYLMDSARYFFGEVKRIASSGYVPTETDVLRAREKVVGIRETRFTMGLFSIHICDVSGQWMERKKWIHCFESATSIIFCSALSEYDQVLSGSDQKTQNRMLESLVLFESVINSKWFQRTSIILFLTKLDAFKDKIPKVPLEQYFPEYTGGPDINKAAKYILWKFMQANRARLSVYPHLTQASDTTNIRLVFAAVKETILQNALKDANPPIL